jgi:hypothetical protein
MVFIPWSGLRWFRLTSTGFLASRRDLVFTLLERRFMFGLFSFEALFRASLDLFLDEHTIL